MTPATPTRLRELTAAAAATAAIGLLVIGVPAALVTGVGWPLTSWRVAVDGVRYGQVSDDLLLAALTAVVWIAWAQLAAALAVEAVAVARGRIAARRRALGVMQPIAARLISAALLVSATIGARPATAAPTGPPTHITATAGITPAALTTAPPPVTTATRQTAVESESAAVSRPVYRVKRHDTLWGIAERRLGDGRRWREIHALNIGRTQPDGRALAADDDAIDVGWRLVMPTDDPGDDPPPDDAVTVDPGDTLTALAGEHLSDPDAWPALYAANVGRPQPDGRTLGDPDLLLVGWRIDIPDIANDAAVVDNAARGRPSGVASVDPGDRRELHAPSPSQPRPVDRRRQQPDHVTAPRPRTGHPADTAAAGGNGHRPDAPGHPAADADDQDSRDDGAAGEWWWVLAGAGMLAAGVAATLTRLRGTWLRRRTTGDQRTPPPPASTAQAATLATEATPDTRDRAVLAVRAYAAGVADLDHPAPVVAGVTIDRAGVIALLLHDTAPDPLPAGWTRDRTDPRQVQLPATVDTADLRASAAAGGPVGAALVTVGIGIRSHRRLLLNLETCGGLALDGPDDLAAATMLAWAVELATSEHADALDVWLVGFDLDTPADGWERLHTVATAADAIAGLRATALGDTTPGALPGRGDPDWLPQIVLCAPTLAPTAVETLTRFVRPYRHAGVVTVTTDDAAAPWRIHMAAGQHTITSLRDPVALRPTRRVSRDDFTAITGLVATAANDATATLTPPTSGTVSAAGRLERIALPATPVEVRHAIDTDRDDLVIVRLLGPVRVTTPDGTQVPGGRLTEAVAYLACHRTGVSADQLVDVLWHGGTATLQRLSEVMSRVRAALGGTGRLPRRDTTGGYRLAPTVVTDLDLIAHHVRHARRAPNRLCEELSAAVELIGGRPFTDVDWMWATFEGVATDAAALACDVACVLGQWHLERDDPAAALRVARYGLRAAPESEQLARLRMRAYHQRGEPDQLRAVMDDLRAAADQPGPDGDDQLHPDTVALYRALTNT